MGAVVFFALFAMLSKPQKKHEEDNVKLQFFLDSLDEPSPFGDENQVPEQAREAIQ